MFKSTKYLIVPFGFLIVFALMNTFEYLINLHTDAGLLGVFTLVCLTVYGSATVFNAFTEGNDDE